MLRTFMAVVFSTEVRIVKPDEGMFMNAPMAKNPVRVN